MSTPLYQETFHKHLVLRKKSQGKVIVSFIKVSVTKQSLHPLFHGNK